MARDNHPVGNGIVFHQAAGDHGRGDDVHALLLVVGTVPEAVSGGGEELQAAKPLVHAPRTLLPYDPCGGDRDENSDEETDYGGKKNKENRLLPAVKDEGLEPRMGHGRAAVPSHE